MLDIFSHYNVWGAFGTTLLLSLYSAIGALVLGTILAVLRLSPVKILRGFGSAFVGFFINLPLTLLVVFSILGMTMIFGMNLDPASIDSNAFRWAVVMLSLYHSAFVCESLRSGVNTIPLGQAEAARSIGLTFGQSMREVILPQAFRGAIAPLGSTLIALIKNTTVVAMIGVMDAAGLMSTMIENEGSGHPEIFIVIALFFVVVTLPLGIASTELSRKMAVKR